MDGDDVFKDFEEKIEGKSEKHSVDKEHEFKHPRKVDEKEHLKKKYQEEKEALKEKYSKEMQRVKSKETHESLKSGKLPSGIGKIERITYIVIIALLIIYLIVDISFLHESNESEEIVKEEIKVEVVEDEESTEKEGIVEEEKNETVEEKEKYSGFITLTMDKIHYEKDSEDDDKGYITKVDFTIDNGKKDVLSPVINVYIYDDKLHQSWETRSRGQYSYPIGIKIGNVQKGSVDISPKTFRNLNLEKHIRLALNDTKDGFLLAANDDVVIS